jgi:hypothetical protein
VEPAALKAVLAVCPGQTFAQTFSELGDSNYYTPVRLPSSGSLEGWQLLNGASVIPSTQPDGSEGSAIDMPSGAVAVSPPTCVTLQYPSARAYIENVEGPSSIAVAVGYENTKALAKPKPLATVKGAQGGWLLSNAFDVQPQLGGKLEETREVRFVFTATGKNSDAHLGAVYIDPRMS